MNPVYDKLMKCYESFRQKIDFKPEVAIVLGSGLGDYADDIRVEAELDYHEIEGFPVSTVPGHAGKFIFGYVGEIPVVCMKGRVHYYEGYPNNSRPALRAESCSPARRHSRGRFPAEPDPRPPRAARRSQQEPGDGLHLRWTA